MANTTPASTAQPEPAADGVGPSTSTGAGRKRPHPEPGSAVGSAPDGRPVLRVPVADEAEAEAGRLAIRFAYTGEVAACSIRQALEPLRVADYLEIKGCGAACAEYISQQLAIAVQGSGSSVPPSYPPALQLYNSSALWPDSAAEPAFAAVLASAKPALVRHFGDALAALNRPALREQLLKLPAAGIEALLESEAFGTDSEDSILTLLATWMRVNWRRTDAATRKRLSGLVRLAQLSSYAASCLLSALSVDYELKGEDHPAGWFPVRAAQSSLVTMYASSVRRQQGFIRQELPFPAWCNMYARPQCVPAAGRSYEWTITREELQAALAGAADSGRAAVLASYDGGKTIISRGFGLKVSIHFMEGTDEAGLSLGPSIPKAYQVKGSELAVGGAYQRLGFPVEVNACLELYRLEDGAYTKDFFKEYNHTDATALHKALGKSISLSATAASNTVDQAGAAPDPLAPWAPYLHEGKIRGSVVLLPAVEEEEDDGGEEDEGEDEDEGDEEDDDDDDEEGTE